MDPNWSYQIEFGLEPLCLYQVRPFRPIEKAGFMVERPEVFRGVVPIVIGTTSAESELLRVVTYPLRGHKDLEGINPNGEQLLFHAGLPNAHFAESLDSLRVLVLSNRHGLLSHGGIKQMRKAPVAVLLPDGFSEELFVDGGQIRFGSDGSSLQVDKV